MQQVDFEDLNRRLATRASQKWFTATARADGPMVEFEAITWRAGRQLTYVRPCRLSEVLRMGTAAMANEFVEIAASTLPPGTPAGDALLPAARPR